MNDTKKNTPPFLDPLRVAVRDALHECNRGTSGRIILDSKAERDIRAALTRPQPAFIEPTKAELTKVFDTWVREYPVNRHYTLNPSEQRLCFTAWMDAITMFGAPEQAAIPLPALNKSELSALLQENREAGDDTTTSEQATEAITRFITDHTRRELASARRVWESEAQERLQTAASELQKAQSECDQLRAQIKAPSPLAAVSEVLTKLRALAQPFTEGPVPRAELGVTITALERLADEYKAKADGRAA
jgi:hypothetical protein